MGGEGDDRGWDGWMASPTQCTWVWVGSGSWWRTGKPGVLQSMGSQSVRQDWATELNSVYSCHLLLISPASVRSIPFSSYIVPIFAWKVPLVSLVFLKRSLVFPILMFSSISLHWSLRKAFYLSLQFFGTLHSNGNIFPFLLCFLLLFSQLFVKSPQTSILVFCISFFLGMVLICVSCTMSWTSIHISSDTLSITSSPLNLFLTSTV